MPRLAVTARTGLQDEYHGCGSGRRRAENGQEKSGGEHRKIELSKRFKLALWAVRQTHEEGRTHFTWESAGSALNKSARGFNPLAVSPRP